MADTARTVESDHAILDALISCASHALAAGVPDDHVEPIETMRAACTLVRNVRFTHAALDRQRLVEVVLRGVEAHAYHQATGIDRRSGGREPDPRSPECTARSAFYTLASTARAYLITTEGGH